jgi:hypothetical protein
VDGAQLLQFLRGRRGTSWVHLLRPPSICFRSISFKLHNRKQQEFTNTPGPQSPPRNQEKGGLGRSGGAGAAGRGRCGAETRCF